MVVVAQRSSIDALVSKGEWSGPGAVLRDVRSVLGKIDSAKMDNETARIYLSGFKVAMAGYALALEYARMAKTLREGESALEWFTSKDPASGELKKP